jgi:hypothetical protein
MVASSGGAVFDAEPSVLLPFAAATGGLSETLHHGDRG